MPLPDYYSTLQVDPQAESDIIDAAYRRLASRFHPDVNRSRGAAERMKMINEAYHVLGDLEKRRAYDLLRANPLRESTGILDNERMPATPIVCAGCGRRFERLLHGRDAYVCPFCARNYFTLLGTVERSQVGVVNGLLSSRRRYRLALGLPEGRQTIQFETSLEQSLQLHEREGVLLHFDAHRQVVLIQNLTLRRLWRLGE